MRHTLGELVWLIALLWLAYGKDGPEQLPEKPFQNRKVELT